MGEPSSVHYALLRHRASCCLTGVRAKRMCTLQRPYCYTNQCNWKTSSRFKQPNLYLGQTVTLMGNLQVQQSRNITNITALPNGNYLLTLDGLPNLDNFTTANGAYVQAYLPGTVNAMQKIYIPSVVPVAQTEGQVNIILPETVQLSGDPLAQISGVDWLINPTTGDLVTDQYEIFDYLTAYKY